VQSFVTLVPESPWRALTAIVFYAAHPSETAGEISLCLID
jgi:hypothetical protein